MRSIESYSLAYNSNYTYTLSGDRARLTVTSDQDAFTARMHWPATSDVARVASVMMDAPVHCEHVPGSDDTQAVYTISRQANAARAARLAYEIADAQRSALMDRLQRIPPTDDDEPLMEHLRRFPEWAEAERRVASAYAEAERLGMGTGK